MLPHVSKINNKLNKNGKIITGNTKCATWHVIPSPLTSNSNNEAGSSQTENSWYAYNKHQLNWEWVFTYFSFLQDCFLYPKNKLSWLTEVNRGPQHHQRLLCADREMMSCALCWSCETSSDNMWFIHRVCPQILNINSSPRGERA